MNIRSSNTKPDIVAEASAWFIEFRAGDVTASDRARFDEWLRRSPEHIQAYLEVAAGWSELPTSDPQGRIDIAALIKRARESQDDNVVPLSACADTRPRRSRQTLRVWAASLAGLALAIGLTAWVALYRANTYSTGVGEQRTVRLVDGSTIELNALSTIRVRLSQKVREIDLTEGQALFHVAKDPARPFIVSSGGTTVRAVGTQFDVYRKRDGTIVTVLEGRVAVAESNLTAALFDQRGASLPVGGVSRADQAPIFVTAGEQVTVTEKEMRQPKRTDVTAATAWTQKRLIFEETPLAEVAEEFNRYNMRRLVITDPDLRSMWISGVYSSTDPDSLLGFLRAQPNILLSETDKEIRVALRDKK
jgi:transmembrane sensor